MYLEVLSSPHILSTDGVTPDACVRQMSCDGHEASVDLILCVLAFDGLVLSKETVSYSADQLTVETKMIFMQQVLLAQPTLQIVHAMVSVCKTWNPCVRERCTQRNRVQYV
jgi:hypothetical protein